MNSWCTKKCYLWYDFIGYTYFNLLNLFWQKANEEMRGMTADPVRKTYWVYTDQSLFELVVTNENRDVWRIYSEKGDYETALKYTRVRVNKPSSYRH